MLPEDRPTIPERYSAAMQSSHLEINNEHTSDLDLLIASGWIRNESLGTCLYRLRTEFDAVNKREIALASSSLMSRLLTMIQLRSLPDARRALGRFAISHATREKFMQPDGVVLKIAGLALDAWLDPSCPGCSGRGLNGGYRCPVILCAACRGSALRSVQFHRTPEGHSFGRSIVSAMDRKTDYVRLMMSRFLRSRPTP